MSETCTIIKDNRRIMSAWSSEGQHPGATVGSPPHNPVTKIEPYHENGQMAPVTWLAVWEGDQIVARLNTAHIAEIGYQD